MLLVSVVIASIAAIALTACPSAAQNAAPPTGAILDLNGQVAPQAPLSSQTPQPQLYSVSFFAPTGDLSAITFAFRDDPGFIQFSNVILTTGDSANLLVNGDFSGAVNAGVPAGWTYSNLSGLGFTGSVSTTCAGFSSCWNDGTVQGYDELSQSVATTAGQMYVLSFYAIEIGGPGVWSSLSTNGNVTDSGGNGADILAYVTGIDGGSGSGGGPGGPGGTPELSTWAMMLTGFLGLGVAGYRRARRTA